MGQRWQSLPKKCQKRRDVQNWSQSRQFRVTNLPDGRMGPQRKPTPTNPHARCGAVRGWPVLSAHFRPEQRTTDGEGPVLVCVLFSWAMKTILQKPLIRMVNFGRSILNTREVDNCPNVIHRRHSGVHARSQVAVSRSKFIWFGTSKSAISDLKNQQFARALTAEDFGNDARRR
jgi:hypothetical protein